MFSRRARCVSGLSFGMALSCPEYPQFRVVVRSPGEIAGPVSVKICPDRAAKVIAPAASQFRIVVRAIPVARQLTKLEPGTGIDQHLIKRTIVLFVARLERPNLCVKSNST